MSPADAAALDVLLAAIAGDPESPSRFPSFYDPDHPTWLVRGGPFLVHYGYDERTDEVVFLNLFRRR